ncbi:hypothetical protein Zmor_008487 [Zophobas morio]|uniref:Uncharacterized protein n=1 Tax=Zophobas morio TaxID=2755281 RepID=A0AA38IWK0_9CUCU|nr:hypothetical protein Zmor_008487 [Zophobas morio]
MVKEKPNSIRIYDEEGFRRRAACICVRSDAETEVSIHLFCENYFGKGCVLEGGQCRGMFMPPFRADWRQFEFQKPEPASGVISTRRNRGPIKFSTMGKIELFCPETRASKIALSIIQVTNRFGILVVVKIGRIIDANPN